MGNNLVTHLSFSFSVACNEVNVYLTMKYFLKIDDSFINFRIYLAKSLIKNSYMNEKICGSPENTIKRKISHILETAPTYGTEYKKKVRT